MSAVTAPRNELNAHSGRAFDAALGGSGSISAWNLWGLVEATSEEAAGDREGRIRSGAQLRVLRWDRGAPNYRQFIGVEENKIELWA